MTSRPAAVGRCSAVQPLSFASHGSSLEERARAEARRGKIFPSKAFTLKGRTLRMGAASPSHTGLNKNMDNRASEFCAMTRRKPAGLLAASQRVSTQSWRKRRRRIVFALFEYQSGPVARRAATPATINFSAKLFTKRRLCAIIASVVKKWGISSVG